MAEPPNVAETDASRAIMQQLVAIDVWFASPEGRAYVETERLRIERAAGWLAIIAKDDPIRSNEFDDIGPPIRL